MASSSDESEASAMSANARDFFMDLDPTKSYRLKDAYVDDWSSDEVQSSSEDEGEGGAEAGTAPTGPGSDSDDDDAAARGGDGEEQINALFPDDGAAAPTEPDPEEDDDAEEDAMQRALEKVEEALEADSDSEAEGGEGKEKKPIPPLPHFVKWRFMRLSRAVLRAVEAAGFQMPTPVQAQVIRPALHGMDICCRAATGSGKTAAFVLPLIDRLRFAPPRRAASVRGLVLEPTREVAFQAHNVLRQLAAHTPLTSCVVAGGVPPLQQMQALQQPVTVAVATPGRLIDLVLNHQCPLSDVEVLVLDEADRLLSCGFQRDIEEILRHLPARRQTLQFSATMTRDVDKLADLALRKPLDVDVGPMGTAQTLRQEFVRVLPGRAFLKPAMLAVICTKFYRRGVIVFCGRRDTAHKLHVLFSLLNLPSAELHGGMSQAQRLRGLADFRERASPVLFTTDVAQRGLDIEGCRSVINFDMPLTLKAYIHRVGRTARMGKQGVAVSFASVGTDDEALLQQIVGLARVNNATAKAKLAAAPEGVKHRKLEDAEVQEWQQRLEAIEGKLKDKLQEDRVAGEIDHLERKVSAVQQRLEQGDEEARRRSTWHLTPKDRKLVKDLQRSEAEGAVPKARAERVAAEREARRGAKFPATDLDNRPIKLPAFSQRLREDEKREKRREAAREEREHRGPQKLTNAERKYKKRQKRTADIDKKRASGKLRPKGAAAERGGKQKDRAKKGNFKSKKRYRRR